MHRNGRSWLARGLATALLSSLLLVGGACAGGRPEGEPVVSTRAGELSCGPDRVAR